jgi:hypothetical protein
VALKCLGISVLCPTQPDAAIHLIPQIVFCLLTAVYIAQTLISVLQCILLAALWGAVEGKCMGSKIVFISTGALTIACDSLILLLPVKIFMSLQAKLARKFALLGILCFGAL